MSIVPTRIRPRLIKKQIEPAPSLVSAANTTRGPPSDLNDINILPARGYRNGWRANQIDLCNALY